MAPRRVLRPLVVALLSLLVLAPSAGHPLVASAASLAFAVSSTTDTHDATPGDGVCTEAASHCTVRAAIASLCPWRPPSTTPGTFTDTHATYRTMLLDADPHRTLTITGTYPAARYASLQAYTVWGAVLAGVADTAFPPDPGSVDPFVAGTLRGRGTYTLHVVFGRVSGPLAGTLSLPVPAGTAIVLAYRIYLPDAAADPLGNVPAPAVSAQYAGGGGPAACPLLPARLARLPAAPSVALTPPASQPTVSAPAAVTATSSFTRVTGQQLGGFGNVDAAYLQASLRPLPALDVVRFTAAATPRTLAGEPFALSAKLRYWSLCIYGATKAPYVCLADERVPTNGTGQVTVVLGPWWARPANATLANGVVWVNLGWFSQPYTAIVRNVLPAPSFAYSAFAVPVGAPAAPYMGSYAPTVTVCSTAQFQQNSCVP